LIHCVVAFIQEARPLIAHYRLQPIKGKHPFTIYAGDGFMLIVSGLGKLAAAAAVGYLQALTLDDGPKAWLNIGIAGHHRLEIGQGFIAHRIQDWATGRAYYPPQILPVAGNTSDLITVDQPERDYSADSGYDMEASGFYPAATRTSTAEFIQSYKVVSDHPQHPVGKITKAIVTKHIAHRMDEIVPLISTLQAAIADYRKLHAPSPHFEKIVQRWHFTATQKTQLKQLLRRMQVLFGDRLPDQTRAESHANAKGFLKALSESLAAHRLDF